MTCLDDNGQVNFEDQALLGAFIHQLQSEIHGATIENFVYRGKRIENAKFNIVINKKYIAPENMNDVLHCLNALNRYNDEKAIENAWMKAHSRLVCH